MSETHRAIEAVWRIESPKVIAALTRKVGDVGLAEDRAQEALLVALEQWPAAGVPRNPALRGYHLLPAVRGDLLHKLGRHDEARVEFTRAAALTRNAPERQLLLQRAREGGGAP